MSWRWAGEVSRAARELEALGTEKGGLQPTFQHSFPADHSLYSSGLLRS